MRCRKANSPWLAEEAASCRFKGKKDVTQSVQRTQSPQRRKARYITPLQMCIALDLGNLVEAALVAAAEVGGGQEDLHHFYGGFGGDDTAAEG